MANKKNNKKSVEYIFVPDGDQAVPVTGVMTTTGNAFNIANQQLGVVVATHNENASGKVWGDYLPASTSADEVDAIKIICGTPWSANTTNANQFGTAPALYESPVIHRDRVRSYSGRIAKVPTYKAELFTGFDATPADLEDYTAYFTLRSVRNDGTYGRALDEWSVNFRTPDYTALSATVTQPLSHLLQGIGEKVNMRSNALSTAPPYKRRGNKAVIALGINIAGDAGTVIGTIDCGDSIPVITTGGVTSSIVADTTLIQTLVDIVANTSVTATSTIEVIDMSDAGLAAGQTIDALLFLGLDQSTADAYDGVYSTKVDVRVELGRSFTDMSGLTKTKGADAFDGQGSGREWKIRYDERAFGQKGLQLTGHKDEFVELPSDLDETKTYFAHVIEFWDTESGMNNESTAPKRIILLWEATVTCNAVGTGLTIANGDTTTTAALDGNLGYWLDTAYKYNAFRYDYDASTAVAPDPGTPGTGVYFA